MAITLLALLAACAPTESPTRPDLQAVTLAGTYTPAPSATPGPRLVTATPSALTGHAVTGCSAAVVAERLRAIPAYTPGAGSWVTVEGASFRLDGQRWTARGVNYYPASAPWQRFAPGNPDARLAVIGGDFEVLHETGLNTVRLFLWYDGLFVCPGSGAVPDLDAVLWLDGIFRLAEVYDLRLILTLNHLPDLAAAPLYDDPGLTLAQTAFLVRRYREEPRLLAWDVRDAGDTDYAPSVYGVPLLDMEPAAGRKQVLDWLARTAAAIRSIDDRHPITAGWSQDSAATVDLVDVVSLQHYGDAISLRARIAELRALTSKPLLLIAAGASSFGVSASDQARRIEDALRVAQADGLAGWLVWTMNDFPTSVTCWPDPCASFDDIRHHFGLWTVEGTPKPAAGVVATQAAR